VRSSWPRTRSSAWSISARARPLCRPLRRAILMQVQDPLAEALLGNRYAEGTTIRVAMDGGEVVFRQRSLGAARRATRGAWPDSCGCNCAVLWLSWRGGESPRILVVAFKFVAPVRAPPWGTRSCEYSELHWITSPRVLERLLGQRWRGFRLQQRRSARPEDIGGLDGEGKFDAWDSANNRATSTATSSYFVHQLPIEGHAVPIPGDYWATQSHNLTTSGTARLVSREKYARPSTSHCRRPSQRARHRVGDEPEGPPRAAECRGPTTAVRDPERARPRVAASPVVGASATAGPVRVQRARQQSTP